MTKYKGVEPITKVHGQDYMIMINHIDQLTKGRFAPLQFATFVTETNKLLYMFLGIELYKGFDLDSEGESPEKKRRLFKKVSDFEPTRID